MQAGLVTMEPCLQPATTFALPLGPLPAQHAQPEITGQPLFAKPVQIYLLAVALVHTLEYVLDVQDHNFSNTMDYLA